MQTPLVPPGTEGRWQWRSLLALPLFLYSTSDAVHSPCTVCGPWSCRPQPRGGCRETASRQDTRQEPGPQFNFEAYAVCRVSFNPQGQTSGLKGTVPQNRSTTTAHGAHGWCKGWRPEYRRRPMGPSCACSLSEQHHPGRRPENRPKPTGRTVRAPLAGRPSPELAGNVPKTGRRRYFFNPAGDCVLLWVFLFVPAVGELSVFVSAVFFGFFGYLLCCVLLVPWSSLVRVCVDGLVFLPRSACIAPPQARLYHLGASVLRGHGSLTVRVSLSGRSKKLCDPCLALRPRSSLLDHA